MDVPKAWQPSAAPAAPKGALERTVITKHPVKTRVPGMGIPSHVKSTKRQTMTEETSPSAAVRILEENVVDGVPFAGKFFVRLDWCAQWLPIPSHRHARHQHQHRSLCRLEVWQQVVYTGKFMLESLVARNSASETGETLKIWEKLALERFHRAEEEDDEVALDPAATSTLNKERGLLSCLKRGLKEPRSLGVWLTALCTSLVLLITCGKLPAAFGGAGAGAGAGGAVPGGIH